MTDIAYHPTHGRALRETFKSLRASEFPWTADPTHLNNPSTGPIHERTRRALRETFHWLRASEFPGTADTTYLNNASTGPIPERTRRALDEFTAKRTAPHLLPDRELVAGLAAARLGGG